MSSLVEFMVVLTGCVSALAAWGMYLLSRKRESRADADERAKAIASEVARPISDKQQELAMAAERQAQHAINVETTLAKVSDRQDLLISRMVEVETKISLFWQTITTQAMGAAKALHQADPARARVDALLESFMDRTMTPEERIELRKILVAMRDWEPGQDLGFPVHPGEKVAAVILLSTMDFAYGASARG